MGDVTASRLPMDLTGTVTLGILWGGGGSETDRVIVGEKSPDLNNGNTIADRSATYLNGVILELWTRGTMLYGIGLMYNEKRWK